MLDCQVAIQEHAFSRYLNAGDIPKPLGTRHPIFTPFQAFEAKDGWVVVAIVGGRNDQWPLFCATIGRLDLIDPPEYRTGHDRTLHYDKLEPILREAFKQKTVDEWIAAFQAVEIACGPVNTIDKVVADPQVQAREMFVEARDASGKVYTLLNTPVKLSRTPGRVDRISPGLGEHTADVLRDWLGLGKDEVERLRREGVL
jgi:CoA:oxalate CoA-transferase